ncbi:hypothetical protein L218DRAFT_949482 [Marasmius fiardii PR-910]|nr:hypothetical protein L218DRAFT_949482 [Marasmius fiardii PR-910]
MAYTRGSSEDYDRLAKVTGDKDWSWKNLQPFILQPNEVITPLTDHHNTKGQYDPSVHGVNSDSLPGFATPIDQRVLRGTQELSREFPFNLDHYTSFHLGIAGWAMSTIGNGERSSSATSYLGPKYAVVLNTRVTRVLSSNTKTTTTTESSMDKGISIETVEVATPANGNRFKAKKEIVLSILMHSGICNSNALTKLGIKTILHNPSVGQSPSDHPTVGNSWFVNKTETWEKIGRNATFAEEVLELWKAKRQGHLVSGVAPQIGWLRIPNNSIAYKQHSDTAAGPNTAHFELIFGNGMRGIPPPEGNTVGIGTVLVSPASHSSESVGFLTMQMLYIHQGGSVQLRSSDPFDSPLIDPNFFGFEFDMTVMKEAIDAARHFAVTKA